MSHYPVTVRLPGNVADDAEDPRLAAALTSALVPYQEHACTGKCPREYMAFHDAEDELAKDYAEGTRDMVELPGGERVCRYDKRFGDRETRTYPPGHKLVEVPFRDCYPTLEDYARDYCGHNARDPETGRFGYWENPNKRWDWWTVGGQGSDKLVVRGGERADVARCRYLDWTEADALTAIAAEKFLAEWRSFCNGKVFGHFDGPRETAFRLGLVACKDADELKGTEWRTIKWERQLRAGVDRFDVLADLADDAVCTLHSEAFHVLTTFARLDPRGGWPAGWVEPGTMGWWGMSSDTPDSLLAYKREHAAWLKSGDQSDWLVVVDCHI